jgi:ubiquinone/menaquinone biosynthesis C-methylase UbiE
VIDVAPVQIKNLHDKLQGKRQWSVLRQDSTDMQFDDASRDAVVVFFLLHEQPLEVRRRTVAEALRITKPGGKLIFVDYHRPKAWSPFRYLMVPILRTLEPFAMDLWRDEITTWLPADCPSAKVEKKTYFAGLYQKVVITR